MAAWNKKQGKCIVCGKPKSIRAEYYCSIKCRTVDWTGQKKPYLLRRIKKICPVCKKVFEAGGRSGKKRDQTYCSNKCSGISQRKTIEHFWNNEGRTSNKKWDIFRKEFAKKHLGICKFCGKKKNRMQIHHVIPRKYGGTNKESNFLNCNAYVRMVF